jgi:hypothetical protein
MMSSRRRRALVAGTFSLLVSGATLVGGAAPASAQVCADVTVYTTITDPHVGDCEPLLNNWISPCYGAWEVTAGFGASVTVCAPSPV